METYWQASEDKQGEIELRNCDDDALVVSLRPREVARLLEYVGTWVIDVLEVVK